MGNVPLGSLRGNAPQRVTQNRLKIRCRPVGESEIVFCDFVFVGGWGAEKLLKQRSYREQCSKV